MNSLNYLIVKEKNKKEIMYFEYDKLKGFKIDSKNKKIKLKDAINVNKMVIINPSFIEKVINKKINLRLKKLIDLIANIYNSDEEDPSGALMQSLNEVEKFKREMINKYINYMTKEQVDLLEKKVKILETEVLQHAYILNERSYQGNEYYQEKYESRKSR